MLDDDKPKYLNSPELRSSTRAGTLRTLRSPAKNRDLDEIMVVEGYMDVIALAQQGIRNAVATLGTATSEEHIKRLFRLVPSILFCFDGDQAGRKAAWRALESAVAAKACRTASACRSVPARARPGQPVSRRGRGYLPAHASPSRPSRWRKYFFQQLMLEADPATLEGKGHTWRPAPRRCWKIPGNNLRLLMRQHYRKSPACPAKTSGCFMPPQPAAVVHGPQERRRLGRRRLLRRQRLLRERALPCAVRRCARLWPAGSATAQELEQGQEALGRQEVDSKKKWDKAAAATSRLRNRHRSAWSPPPSTPCTPCCIIRSWP